MLMIILGSGLVFISVILGCLTYFGYVQCLSNAKRRRKRNQNFRKKHHKQLDDEIILSFDGCEMAVVQQEPGIELQGIELTNVEANSAVPGMSNAIPTAAPAIALSLSSELDLSTSTKGAAPSFGRTSTRGSKRMNRNNSNNTQGNIDERKREIQYQQKILDTASENKVGGGTTVWTISGKTNKVVGGSSSKARVSKAVKKRKPVENRKSTSSSEGRASSMQRPPRPPSVKNTMDRPAIALVGGGFSNSPNNSPYNSPRNSPRNSGITTFTPRGSGSMTTQPLHGFRSHEHHRETYGSGSAVEVEASQQTVGMQIDTMFGSGKLVEQRLDGFDVVELKHWQLTGSSKVVVYFKTSRNVLLENRKY